jgi:hypothetical protein
MRFDALGCCLLVLPLELSALSGCVLRSGYLELARSKITDFLALFNSLLEFNGHILESVRKFSGLKRIVEPDFLSPQLFFPSGSAAALVAFLNILRIDSRLTGASVSTTTSELSEAKELCSMTTKLDWFS